MDRQQASQIIHDSANKDLNEFFPLVNEDINRCIEERVAKKKRHAFQAATVAEGRVSQVQRLLRARV